MDATEFFPMLGIFLLVCLAAGVLAGFVFLIIVLVKLLKRRLIGAFFCYLWMIACILLMLASWIMNMGWIRFFLTFMGVPFIHPALLVAINSLALMRADRAPKLKYYSVFSCLAALGTYFLLPDGGDIGPRYFFFGLVHHDQAADIAGVFGTLFLIAHILFTVLQLVAVSRISRADAERSKGSGREEQ